MNEIVEAGIVIACKVQAMMDRETEAEKGLQEAEALALRQRREKEAITGDVEMLCAALATLSVSWANISTPDGVKMAGVLKRCGRQNNIGTYRNTERGG